MVIKLLFTLSFPVGAFLTSIRAVQALPALFRVRCEQLVAAFSLTPALRFDVNARPGQENTGFLTKNTHF
jgi:hypothetical protein